MVHKPSERKLQERKAKRFILNSAFVDRVNHETVCLVDRVDVLSVLQEPVQVSSVPSVERGEVLLDPRGQGSFQACKFPVEEH